MVGGQKIQVGLVHARKTAAVTVEADTYQITVEPGITISAPRTTSRDIRRHKGVDLPAAGYRPEPARCQGTAGSTLRVRVARG
jgi:hypothetical protein